MNKFSTLVLVWITSAVSVSGQGITIKPGMAPPPADTVTITKAEGVWWFNGNGLADDQRLEVTFKVTGTPGAICTFVLGAEPDSSGEDVYQCGATTVQVTLDGSGSAVGKVIVGDTRHNLLRFCENSWSVVVWEANTAGWNSGSPFYVPCVGVAGPPAGGGD